MRSKFLVRARAAVAVATVGAGIGVLAPAAPAGAAAAPVVVGAEVVQVAAGAVVPLTAEVTGADSVIASVVVGFDAPVTVAMADDGVAPDVVAGDGTWTASLAGQPAGTLVRARITASNVDGFTDFPAGALDALNEQSYVGAVIDRPPVASALPVIDLYIAPSEHHALMTELGSKTYRPAVLAVDGVVYDGIRIRLQGGAVTQAQPKKNFRVKMPRRLDLVAPGLSARPLREFVLDADGGDPTGLRTELAWRAIDHAGGHTLAHNKVRLERGNQFEGLYTFLEEYDEDWMEANGFGDGLLYESDDSSYLIDVGPEALGEVWDQKEPEDAPHDALAEWAAAIDSAPSAAASADLLQRTDLAALVNYYALNTVLGNIDTLNHNIWLAWSPTNERWVPLHWDLDLTFGEVAGPQEGLPVMPSIVNLADAIAYEPRLTAMVMRRLRTLSDELLAEGRIADWYADSAPEVAADLALDDARWPKATTRAAMEAQMLGWLDQRQALIEGPWSEVGVPPSATASDTVVISEIRYSGDPGGDFIELANPGATAVDVSGWRLSGAASATLPAGSVVPAGDRVVLAASSLAIDAAARGRLVVGSLDGPIPDSGGTVTLTDRNSTERSRVAFTAGSPWPAAPAGRSIELAEVTPATPTSAAAWRASETVGGTPGADWAPPTGLKVSTWVDGSFVATAAPLTGSVEVVNHGPGPVSSVMVTAPGCSRSLGTMAPGARRVLRCAFTAPNAFFGYSFFTAKVTSSAGTVDALPRLLSAVSGVNDAVPSLNRVLLDGAGGLLADWNPAPGARRHQLVELAPATATPTRGTPVTGDSAVLEPGLGIPVRVAVTAQVLVAGRLSVPTPALTPRPSQVWPAATASAWAQRTLSILLGRTPTAAELNQWTSALTSGTPPAQLVDDVVFAAGSRWSLREAKVARLYAAFFDRPAETAGLVYWSDRLAAGANISVVAESFARSPEFQTRFGAGSHADFVDLVYRNVLRRAPGPGDIDYWVGRIQSGRTRGWVMAAFSETAEGKARLAPWSDPVVITFALTAATPGRQAWEDAIAWLRAGGSRLTVVESVRSSAAYATAYAG